MSDEVKEPIRNKWIWIGLAFIVLAIVPWYWPKGALQSMILGFPLWAFVSTLFSLILCGYLSWLCLHQWHLVEDKEEAERRGEGDEG